MLGQKMNTFRSASRLLVALLLTVLLAGLVFLSSATSPVAEATPAVKADTDWGRMPLYFIENQGQTDDAVAYYVQGQDKTLYFTPEGLTYSLAGKDGAAGWTTKLNYLGARKMAPQGEDQSEAVISYFKGSPEDWETGLSTYSTILCPGLWKGIDLVYSGTQDQLKQEFLLAPGADPTQIRLSYRGASLELNDKGELVVSTPAGSFTDAAPVAWQEVDGKRTYVPVEYDLGAATGSGAQETTPYSFKVGSYDLTLPLVIDPVVLVYCGYFGSSDSNGNGIAVDSHGCAYVTGNTTSAATSFPETAGPDVSFNGGAAYGDAFVAKVKADGTGFVYCGYIGGSGEDVGLGIAVDSSGCAYVTGGTGSSEATFPAAVGPGLTYRGGGGNYDDAFIAKVNAAGTGLVYCGYIAGNAVDCGRGIAVDASGNAYVSGYTKSTEASFPHVAGPDLTYNGGGDYYGDAFVAKVKADGTGFVYCGYIGGSADDAGNAIAVDGSGNAYVTGCTASDEHTFPVKGGPDASYNGGACWGGDSFVAKVNAAGTALSYCGYIGGSGDDFGYGIAVDSNACAYVTGQTRSTEGSFPVLAGPDLTFNGGTYDAFVAKVAADGNRLVYCGYVGGSGCDCGKGIAVDGGGKAYLVGDTASGEATFPEALGPDLSHNGQTDVFVGKVDAVGAGLVYCGYVGGADYDSGNGIAVDATGNAYVAGWARSAAGSFPETVGPGLTHSGGYSDAFVTKIVVVPTRYEETSTKLGYSGTWTSGAGSAYSGGSYKKGSAAGSTVVVKFSGNSLAWITTKRSDLGIARVTLDYGTPVEVDLYRSVTAHKQKVWQTPAALVSGTHTLIIEWTGKKRAASTGTSISMDAFDAIGTLAQAPIRYQQKSGKLLYSSGWTTAAHTSASGASYSYASATNAKVTVRFTGTSITWVGVKSSNYGKAKVTLDGVYKGTIDLYSASTKWGVRLFAATVPAGNHTLVITCTGTKQGASSGKRISADAFDVSGKLY